MNSPRRRRPNSKVADQAKKYGVALMSGSPRRYKTATKLREQIARKKRSRSPPRKSPTTKPKRPSPTVHAKYHKAGRKSPSKSANSAQNRGTFATGNDGNRWQSRRMKNGVYTWRRA